MKVRPAIVWHYTTVVRFHDILRDGFIKPATARLQPGERPAVWFSSNPVWEETVNKRAVFDGHLISLNREQTALVGDGLIRIAVSSFVAPHDWESFKRTSGVSPMYARLLYRAGIAWGSRPGQWFVTYDPVPRDLWLSVELWVDDHWQPIDVNDFSQSILPIPASNSDHGEQSPGECPDQ